VKTKRLKPAERRSYIINAAADVAMVRGYNTVTREEVARAAKVSQGLINVYFGSVENLRKHILYHAIQHEIPEIIAQYLAIGGGVIVVPEKLRQRAADFVRTENAQDTPRV